MQTSFGLASIGCRGGAFRPIPLISGALADGVHGGTAAAAGSQAIFKAFVSVVGCGPGAPYQRHDDRFPPFIRSSRRGFEATIGCPVHAAWPGREFLHQAVGAAEPPPDLAGASVGALGTALELGLIRQAMAEPAAETRPAIQDAALAMASWTSEPLSLSTERCLCRPYLIRSSILSAEPSEVVV